eukprot:Plantae.Rhodophyta-Hildenbrandia_rubra.ctg5541.p1 GENE.Plantae.Rhodophyta-Hildenbrandia_rubra.ctg5541~~Plantae.Rhodophyta-Hildenbrandia_rubra.ctg5541.p1  ORF type:complete len:235 (-),score=31.57 Plantae.Rhodophyta-Hildenbrandia_rubra.ctg5541:426-1130(-)
MAPIVSILMSIVLGSFFAISAALPVESSIKQELPGRGDQCSPFAANPCVEDLTCVFVEGQDTGACLNLANSNPFPARLSVAQALEGGQGERCSVRIPGHCEEGTRCLFASNGANGFCQDDTTFDPQLSPSPIQVASPPARNQPCNPEAEAPCDQDPDLNLTCTFVATEGKSSEGVCLDLDSVNPFVARLPNARALSGGQGQRCHVLVSGHCEEGLTCLSGSNPANGSCSNLGGN